MTMMYDRSSISSSIASFLGLFLLVGLLTGCDSLEFSDPNAPNADAVSLQNLATGTEGAMRGNLNIYYQTTGIFGREAYYFEPADPRYTDELYVGPLDPNGFLVTNPWSARYRAIRNANDLITRAEDIREATPDAFSEADLNAAVGFARTIIGYQLLLVLNSTWDNGLKTEFNDDVTTDVVSRASAFVEIDQYLDGGFNALQSAGATFPFQLSAGFSEQGFGTPAGFAEFNRAIRARSAAYQEDYLAANTALVESFVSPDEADLDVGAYHVYATGVGERLNPLFEVPTAPSVKLRAHPSILNDARPGDTRFTSKVLDRTADAESSDNDFEASPPAANGLESAFVVTLYDGSTSPVPIIRNEELLLIRAEANIRGDTPDLNAAVDDLNIVRRAAGLGNYTGAVTEEALFEELIYNRQYSLFLEGHRWVDARRFGRLDELEFAYDTVGDGSRPSIVFEQVPIPQNETPEN
jgi:starch-binding outer membrane protein, SusD/RagB family